MNSFRCAYCNKGYTRESWFRKHRCAKQDRFEQRNRMDFRQGLRLYTHWRVRNGYVTRGKPVTAEKFVSSQFYNAFMTLVKYTSDNWVITSIRYLDFLIDYHIGDAKWTNDDTLKTYREYIRRHEDPISQSKITYEAIISWCDKNSVDRREFFVKIPPGVALKMIASNQLSPWVLFGYDRARDLLNRVNDDWLCSVNEYINNKYWIGKIADSEDRQRSIQTECERLFGEI